MSSKFVVQWMDGDRAVVEFFRRDTDYPSVIVPRVHALWDGNHPEAMIRLKSMKDVVERN